MIRQLQNTKKKIIKYNSIFVPAEMIYAFNAVPFFVCIGGNSSLAELALSDALRFMNPLARSVIGDYMLEKDSNIKHTDLYVIPQIDCHVIRMSEMLESHGKSVFKLAVPSDFERQHSFEYYFNSLKKMQYRLEELTKHNMDEKKLREALENTNKISELLFKIDLLRKEKYSLVSGGDFVKLNHEVFFFEQKEEIQRLEEFYSKALQIKKIKKDKPRIILAGHALAVGDVMLIEMVEERGGCVVHEIFDEGLFDYKGKIALEGDLLSNFAERRYLKKLPINSFQNSWKKRYEYAKELLNEYQADGIIWYQLSFDEIYDLEYKVWSELAAKDKIPMIRVETSYENSEETKAQLSTRVESFIEMINWKYV